METVQRFRPTPTDEYLANPHKGCCTFQHFNGDVLFDGVRWSEEGPIEFPPRVAADVIDGYLPSTVSYCRWFWSILEPAQGEYDFGVIDKSLEVCAQRGQSLAVRLMAFGSVNQPPVPQWYSKSCPMTSTIRHGKPFDMPDHDSPQYLKHWGGLIREFGRRYDGHPLLESMDVAFLGPWGEGAGDCCKARIGEFAQLWAEALPKTPRLALVGGDQMAAAVRTGTGWRCDCFGDLRTRGSPTVHRHLSFNHHFDCYPQQVFLSGATDAWKKQPVHFETCGVPMGWYRDGYDIDLIIEQGYKFHGTYFMPKSTRLPEKWMDKLAAFCRKLGYRFALRQVMTETRVAAGGELTFKCWIENVGVAPIYRQYDLALRFRQGDQSFIVPFKDLDIRTWLPGDFCMDTKVALPKGLQRGVVELSLGLLDPVTQEPKVSFAVKERFSDRWTPLGIVEII